MRILIVDDNEACAESVGAVFEDEGFVVDRMATLEDATESVRTVPYDAVITDRVLPDGDGLEWLREQRRGGNTTPMLIMTGEHDAVDSRVDGLNAGADDYVVKPMPLAELVARVRALLRRPTAVLETLLRAGNVTFDPNHREVCVDGRPIQMPRRETSIFEMLIRRVGKTVTKTTLEEGLYSFEEGVSSNAIQVGIYRLRGHLEASDADIEIRTLRGSGYRLDVPAEQTDTSMTPELAEDVTTCADVAVTVASDNPEAVPILCDLVLDLANQKKKREKKVGAFADAIAVSMTDAPIDKIAQTPKRTEQRRRMAD